MIDSNHYNTALFFYSSSRVPPLIYKFDHQFLWAVKQKKHFLHIFFLSNFLTLLRAIYNQFASFASICDISTIYAFILSSFYLLFGRKDLHMPTISPRGVAIRRKIFFFCFFYLRFFFTLDYGFFRLMTGEERAIRGGRNPLSGSRQLQEKKTERIFFDKGGGGRPGNSIKLIFHCSFAGRNFSYSAIPVPNDFNRLRGMYIRFIMSTCNDFNHFRDAGYSGYLGI